MRKRLLSICLALCMMLALVPQMEIETKAASGFQPIWPCNPSTAHVYGVDTYYNGGTHNGIDITAVPATDPNIYQEVYAVAKGTVVEARNSCTHESEGAYHACPGSDTWGNYICIRHDVNGQTYYSIYAHLKYNSLKVKYGDTVDPGDVIAQMGSSGGSTGHHLHLEVWKGSRSDRNDGRINYSFDYYVNNPSALSGVMFQAGLASYSTSYKSWIKNNCTLSNGVYVYKATPPTATLSTDRTYYNVGDTVTFTLGDSTATSFYIGIYKDGERIDGLNVGSTYTRVFDEPGSYSAYMTASNSAGYTDSNWVYWEVAEPNYLDRSTYYPCYLKVKTTSNTQLRTLPDSGSDLVLTLSKGEIQTVTGLYYNPDYEFWYRTEYDGQTCYLYAGNVEVVEFLTSTTVSGVKAPTTLDVGQSFTLEGIVSSEYAELFQVAAAVETGTETVLHAWDGTTSNTYSIKSSNVDHGIPLDSLSTGYYAYIIYVGERHYYWDGDSLESVKRWPGIYRSSFTVGSPSSSTPGKPALKNMKSTYEEGETVVFDWDTTVNTTHYNLYLEEKNRDGDYVRIENNFYAKPTITRTFPKGDFRAWLQATNSSALTPDGSTWAYTDADLVYFRVGCKHSSTTQTAAKAATCTVAGNKAYYTCSSCKEVFKDAAATQPTTKEAMTIAKLGHSLNTIDAKAATCTENGNIAFYYCNRCSNRYTDTAGETAVTQAGTVIQALGHSWDEGKVTTAPSYTADGVMTYTCTRGCGETKTEPIPALEHHYESVVTAPTCTAGGYTTYTCTECGDSYITDRTAALDHDYVDGTCTRCGDIEEVVETAVAETVIGGVTTSYDDITEAVTALVDTTAADKAVLRLVGDIELAESLGIKDSVFTLDLNGHTIRCAEQSAIKLGLDVEMILIDSSAGQTGVIEAVKEYGIAIYQNAVLTINSGTVRSDYAAILTYSGTGVSHQLIINGGVLESNGYTVIRAGNDVRISGGELIQNSTSIKDTYIDQECGTVSFEGCTGDLTGMTIFIYGGCNPAPKIEDYHLPEGYCFYSYSELSGSIGTQPITQVRDVRTYIIGKVPTTEPDDELTCTFAEKKAVLSGDLLETYLETNAQLMMAAYDGNGRFLGIQDSVSQLGDGSYQLIIEAEGIETVRFFVMDGGYIPLVTAYIFK